MSAPSQAGAGAWPSGVLNRDTTLEILTYHNRWRRGAKGEQTDPRMLGLALEAVIAAMTNPPAAVPVEALEGLVDNWKRFSEARGGADPVADDQRPGLAIAADELTTLIKERSNG